MERKPDFTTALGFLEAITGTEDPVALFATFPDSGSGPAKHHHGRLSQVWPRLVSDNSQGRGVFFTVNETRADRRRAEDVVGVRAVFTDNDHGWAPDPKDCHLPPSVMVNSGHGRHTYWLVEDGFPLERFSEIQRRLAARYGTDPAVIDLPRVMRLPGLYHCKGPVPFLVEWFDVDPTGDAVYSVSGIEAGLPPDPKGQAPASGTSPAGVGFSLPNPNTEAVKKSDLQRLKSSKKTPGWCSEILENVIAGDKPIVNPDEHPGEVDTLITKHLAWICNRIPGMDVASVVALYTPSWLVLQGMDKAANRATYTLEELTTKIARALVFIHEKRKELLAQSPWLDWIARDGDGFPLPTRSNVEIVLRNHFEWEGVIAYNDRARRLVYRKPPPWVGEPWAPKNAPNAGDAVTEHHLGLMVTWFARAEHLHLPRIPSNILWEAVEAAGRASEFDPFKEYVQALQWDGKPRLVDWLPTYLGAEETDFNRAIGPRWMIAAVARTVRPGAKVDEMLVLEGPQGVRKSTALRTLAGEDYFSDSLPRGGDVVDLMSHLSGPVVIEIPEVDGINRKREASEVKAFLSKQTDRFRPKYGRAEIELPRRCVFAGSTNEFEYLFDPTGARRFWPVAVATRKPIDIARLSRDRDQLWAEARVMYEAGLAWHLSPRETELAAVVQGQRSTEDTWEALIRDYVRGKGRHLPGMPDPIGAGEPKPEVTIGEILSDVLDVPKSRRNGVDGRRVGHILRKMGFLRKHTKNGNVWRWVPGLKLGSGRTTAKTPTEYRG